MNTKLIRKPDIIIFDRSLTFLEGLKTIISFKQIGTVVGDATNEKGFFNLLSHTIPDLVLIDIDMSNLNAMEVIRKALKRKPGLKIIAFTMFKEEDYLSKMIEPGISGFILKLSGLNELAEAVECTMKGRYYISNELAGKITGCMNRKNPGKAPGRYGFHPEKPNYSHKSAFV